MNENSLTIESLQSRLQELETENAYLKSLFNQAGVPYTPVYERDLQEALRKIIISSPTLARYKVIRMIQILKERQEAGVKVTIVTWHPDAYMYGHEAYRLELMEMLQNNGFHIELMKESCEHYAVIDNEIVWYGSMNLLSKEDVEDNIMRVVSKEIASELLEMTFGNGNSRCEMNKIIL